MYNLGFTSRDNEIPPEDKSTIDQARSVVIELIYAGEELLLLNKRLAQSKASVGFLYSHDLLEHWERYEQTGRIAKEIDQLVEDSYELATGYEALIISDNEFLTDYRDLPKELAADFRLARNLFSVGFDEVGVLISGRGLEAVLRMIAEKRKIMIEIKGRTEPAWEADTFDLIEAMSRLRWKIKRNRLLTPDAKALLHYLRTLRNQRAHPESNSPPFPVGPREMTTIVSKTANQLWKETSSTKAKLEITTIQKTW